MALIHQVIDGAPREVRVADETVAIWQESGWSAGPWPGLRDDFGTPIVDPLDDEPLTIDDDPEFDVDTSTISDPED